MTALVWAAVLAFAVERWARVADRWVVARHPAPSAAPEAEPPIPRDLLALAAQYPDPWAQEDVLKVIREKYAEFKDWQLVRSAMGVALTPGDA